MRTLGDITVQANNTKLRKREPSWKKLQETPDSRQDENISNAQVRALKHNNAPRFMSPTVASTSQGVTPGAKAATRTSTPISFASSTAKSRNWVASAVKRVAMRRSGDTTAPAKEEIVLPKASSFTRSDKISVPLTSSIRNVTNNSITRKSVLTDKPLPSPPVAQVNTVNASRETRSLIDASEKPLRRSPPGKPHQEEDWPVLFPEKPTTPGTLQEMARQEGPYPSVRAMRIAQRERLSALANVESRIPSIQRKAVASDSPSSSGQSIDRKPVHKSGTPNLQATGLNKVIATTDSSSRTVREVRSEQELRTSAFKEHLPTFQTPSPHVAVQKSVDRLQDLSYSRPTKLSSLRAQTLTRRPSTEVASTSNKELDREDSSTTNNNSATTAIRASPSKTEPIVTSRSPTVEPRTKNTGSASRSQGDRAPTKLAIRTRHPEVPSRSSSSTPIPLLCSPPPNKPLPALPKFQGPSKFGLGADGNRPKTPTPEPRKSSIPVPRRHAAGSPRDWSGRTETQAKKVQKSNEPGEKRETSLHVLEDAVTTESMATIEKIEKVKAVEIYDTPTSSDHLGSTLRLPATQSPDQITSGKAIKEASPRENRIKRLSRLSPDYGPVLKISHSADVIIMGTESGKQENTVAHPKKDDDLYRKVVTKQLRKASFGGEARPTTFKQTLRPRPFSAAGNIQQTSRHVVPDPNARQKKALSVDATNAWLTPGHVQRLTSRASLKARASEHTIAGTDDPFLDAKAHLGDATNLIYKESQFEAVAELSDDTPFQVECAKGSNDTKSEPGNGIISKDIQEVHMEGGASSHDTETCSVHEGKKIQIDANNVLANNEAAEDEDGLSPKSDGQGRTQFGDKVPHTRALPPAAVRDLSSGAQPDFNAEHVTQSAVPVSGKMRHMPSSPIDIGNRNISPKDQMVTLEEMLTPPSQSSPTPGTCLRRPPNWVLNEFPPRSSSHARVQDFTTERHRTCPASPRYVNPRQSKDYQPIQERLGSSKGVPSIRYNPEAARSSRSSITRESNKTQGSISKGMLSNFRGLFHKRPSDASDQQSTKYTKCNKRVGITGAGSPYPPISEVHPIHRPMKHRKTGSTTRPATPEPIWGISSRADTLVSHSSQASDASITNSLTVQLIDSAKRAPPGPRQDRLWQLSNIMVDAVTNARDAQKAKEEAKQATEVAKHAARRAEMACLLTHKRAADLARFVQEHMEVLE